MASSRSVKRSQNILTCGLCDVNTKVKVKCMDCDLYLCETCEERHSRFKHADSHSVLAIRDIHLHKDEESGKEEFKPIKCKIHRTQFCSVFCQTCDDLICPICIVETHQKHELQTVEIMCKKKCDDLKMLKDDAERKTRMYLQEQEGVQKNVHSKYDEIERVLEAKIKEMQELQMRHSKELLTIKDVKKQLHGHTARYGNTVSEAQKVISEAEIEMKESLKSRNVEKFLSTAKNLETRIKTFQETIKPQEPMMNALQSICGDYTSAVSTFTNNNITLTKLKSFPIKDSLNVYSITSNQIDSVWITNTFKKQIQQLELRDNRKIMHSHTYADREFPEIRCFGENELLLTMSTKISRLNTNGKQETFRDFSPLKVNTLHVTRSCDIVVGMDLEDIDMKQDKPVIVLLGNNGETKSEFKNSGGQLLQNDIVRSCTALHEDVICYIDSMDSGKKCRLVALNKNGYIKWTYNGNSNLNSEEHPFSPIEVISTKNNNILTSDNYQHAIHILTSAGSLLTILDLTLLGIKTPGVMALVNSQILWVEADDNGDNKTIFKLEISGF